MGTDGSLKLLMKFALLLTLFYRYIYLKFKLIQNSFMIVNKLQYKNNERSG